MNSLNDFVSYVRMHSDFYKNFYKNAPDLITDISQLPIIDSQLYWDENRKINSTAYTSAPNGMAFKSGGTTGRPKFTVCTFDEIEIMARAVGTSLKDSNLNDGDRIANCMALGDLNGSFIFYNECFKYCGSDVLVFPIGNAVTPATAWNYIIEGKLNVIFGTPTYLTSLFKYFNQNKINYFGVNKIYFLGEHILPYNLEVIKLQNPQINVTSAGHTSVDVGIMGYSEANVLNGEHRAFDGTILEIVDLETNEVITETNTPGRLICTNLMRRLMPVIRYSAGDICEWLEPAGTKNRKYKLHKRTPEAWSFASGAYHFSDVEEILNPLTKRMGITAFQIKISNIEGRDKLTVYLATPDPKDPKLSEFSHEVIDNLIKGLPHMQMFMKTLWPIEVFWVDFDNLAKNERTGKLKRIIDDRILDVKT